MHGPSVLIIHSINHWVTVTNIYYINNIPYFSKNEWNLYDSLNLPCYEMDATKTLRRISPYFTLSRVSCNLQSGSSDCGLFAIGFAIALCEEINPASLKFNQDRMRKHYDNCINKCLFSQFPLI